jgi:hypothetical protein
MDRRHFIKLAALAAGGASFAGGSPFAQARQASEEPESPIYLALNMSKVANNEESFWLMKKVEPRDGRAGLEIHTDLANGTKQKMNNVLRQKSWSPYVAGSSAGILLCLSALITGEYIGASTTFVRSAGLIEKIFVPERVAKNDGAKIFPCRCFPASSQAL